MPTPEFPQAEFDGFQAEFHPAPFDPPEPPFASLIVPWHNDRIVFVNVKNRGWCIPSGHVEPGESPDQTARREAKEEAGINLTNLTLLGVYKLSKDGKTRYATLFTADSTPPGSPEIPEEILEVKTFALNDLPKIYYTWNPLFEAVFAHAETQRA